MEFFVSKEEEGRKERKWSRRKEMKGNDEGRNSGMLGKQKERKRKGGRTKDGKRTG